MSFYEEMIMNTEPEDLKAIEMTLNRVFLIAPNSISLDGTDLEGQAHSFVISERCAKKNNFEEGVKVRVLCFKDTEQLLKVVRIG